MTTSVCDHCLQSPCQCKTFEEQLAPVSFDAVRTQGEGNSVELRTVGRHKWLFINGVHIAKVRCTSLTHARDALTEFTVTFEVTQLKGFDHE